MSLKARRPGSDTPSMFFSAQSAPDPATTPLLLLRLSLNRPVLAVDELPSGPASAAIALVGGPVQGRRLVVAIRSMRNDQVVFFASEWLPHGVGDSARLLDAAVAFSESMGFLFDDVLDPASEASRLWAEWVGKAASPPRGASPLQRAVSPPSPPRAAAISLTKFRLRSGGASIGRRLDRPMTDIDDEGRDCARSA